LFVFITVFVCAISTLIFLPQSFPLETKMNRPGDNGKSWQGGTTGTALNGSQQVQLQAIRDRDAEFDQDLDEIGEGISDLHELAKRQGEEVKRQNEMLNKVSDRIDSATEKMINVNAKMKDTLDQVGRSSDKLCVDIMCIMLMAGFGAVFYNVAKTYS